MEQTKTKLTDMTQGSPTKLILAFTLPLLLGNLLQQLYNMVDSIVVGQFVGKVALAAVGTGFPVIFMMGALFMGLGMGAMVMIAQYYGAGDMDRVRSTISTIYTTMFIVIVPLTVLGIVISGPMLHLMNVPDDTFELAKLYMVIVFFGMIGSFGYNINSGILQGLGDSKTPLIFLAIASILNIVLDLLFVVVFHWGVAGVAIATIVAQAFSWLFGIFYINKKYPELHLNPLRFHFDKELFKKIMKLGVPAGIQQMLFSIGVMMMQSLVNSYGSDFMAGFNAANKIDTFAFMPLQSFSSAITTYVGQNIGAGRVDRVRRGSQVTVAMGVAFSIFAGIVLILGGPFCLRLFTDDAAVIHAGMAYLYRIAPFYSLLAVMFILNGVMRGAGAVLIPTLSSILSLWLARVPSAYILAHFFGGESMYFCYLFGWIVGVCIVLPYYLAGKWKDKSVVQHQLIHGD